VAACEQLLPILSEFLLFADGTVCVHRLCVLACMRQVVGGGEGEGIDRRLEVACALIKSRPERFLCDTCMPRVSREHRLSQLTVYAGAVRLRRLPGSAGFTEVCVALDCAECTLVL